MAIKARNKINPLNPAHLESIAKVLGATEGGLTGSQIGVLLSACGVPDIDPTATKWHRLYNAFASFQNEHQVGNHVVAFVNCAMDPARYVDDPRVFDDRQRRLNAVLSLAGMQVRNDGKVVRATTTTTAAEAAARASRLAAELKRRGAHAEVLRFCKAEVIQVNYFHALLEAAKSLTSRLRSMSGSTNDGSELVDDALAVKNGSSPRIRLSELDTETKRGQQRGFCNLLKGFYGFTRNPLAHEPKIEWEFSEEDALDMFSLLSLIHRKLDSAERSSKGGPHASS